MEVPYKSGLYTWGCLRSVSAHEAGEGPHAATIWESIGYKPEAACLESFYFDVILSKGVADLTRRQAKQAASLGLDPAGPLHGPEQAVARGGEFRLVWAAIADSHAQQLADRRIVQRVDWNDSVHGGRSRRRQRAGRRLNGGRNRW